MRNQETIEASAVDEFRRDVLTGLRASPRTLPCKYLYDERGSQIFDLICELEEYYLTRAETEIMERFAPEMADSIGPGALLIELGSGSSVKTRLLLDHLEKPAAYVPIDISREHLVRSAADLADAYPHVEVAPVCADYMQPFELPTPRETAKRRIVFFPGSTIGNMHHADARRFLQRMARLCGPRGGMIVGADLRKDRRTLEAAYNDAEGVTAEFNLNLLRRINRELDADFDLGAYVFRAIWNEDAGRIESYVVSQCDQIVTIGDERIEFGKGDRIRTECSYKYAVKEFADLAAHAGFEVARVWMDEGKRFSDLYLEVK